MFCIKCGAKIENNGKFCGSCGTVTNSQIIVKSPLNPVPSNQTLQINAPLSDGNKARSRSAIVAMISAIILIIMLFGSYAGFISGLGNRIIITVASSAILFVSLVIHIIHRKDKPQEETQPLSPNIQADNYTPLFCFSCGNPVAQGAQFCLNCGVNINAYQHPAPVSCASPKKPSVAGLVIFGFISLIASVPVYFYGQHVRQMTSIVNHFPSNTLVQRYGWNGGGHYIQIGIALFILCVVFFVLAFWKRNRK
ncbi:MAG: zinc ribbon domain-containing protein [Oscillospiraceae bacterium]|nr:zinc ribbon domain-containing protein [Oscillospiraceae bacterium]